MVRLLDCLRPPVPRSSVVALVMLFASACAPQQRGAVPSAEEAFLDNYLPYCGHAYAGHSTLVELGENHPLEGADLLMILDDCREGEVRIPFHVDEDRSRTWIVRRAGDGRLHLSHDHRYPDGTEYEANMYGGYSDGEGDATTVFFPADEATIAERPGREINRWAKSFDHSAERYYYRLYLRDTLRYEAEFDLSNPLPAENYN